MSSPILPKSVEVSKFKYSEIKTLSSGSKSIYVNYGSQKLRVQTPVMFMPYGIGEGFEDKTIKNPEVKKNADKKYDVTISFKGVDENPKIQTFLDKMKEIEQEIIDKAFDNREAWFKDDYDGNKAFVARMFSPMIKIDKDKKTGKVIGKYPPTFRAKIPYDGENDKFTFDALDMENNEIDFKEVLPKLKGGKTQLIIEMASIWIAGGKYGLTWKVVSAKFQPSMMNKMVFLEDSDTEKAVKEEEENEEDDIDANEDDISPAAAVSKLETTIPNSDGEEETSEQDDKEEKEEPVKTATRGRKTTKK
uniref:Uncharacterized protein n=1 Tax=viral metagenome TaxID=1070528 RepID=A0A6C0CGH6_9ZZZZ